MLDMAENPTNCMAASTQFPMLGRHLPPFFFPCYIDTVDVISWM